MDSPKERNNANEQWYFENYKSDSKRASKIIRETTNIINNLPYPSTDDLTDNLRQLWIGVRKNPEQKMEVIAPTDTKILLNVLVNTILQEIKQNNISEQKECVHCKRMNNLENKFCVSCGKEF